MHVLSRNLNLDQRSTLQNLQRKTIEMQLSMYEKVIQGVEALIVVEKIIRGFEDAMEQNEWKSLGSEE